MDELMEDETSSSPGSINEEVPPSSPGLNNEDVPPSSPGLNSEDVPMDEPLSSPGSNSEDVPPDTPTLPISNPVADYFYLKSVTDLKIYSFKITLLESDPVIWRRLFVPSTFTFFQFHGAIQDAMGWQDVATHRHQFQLNDTIIELPRKSQKIQEFIDMIGNTSNEMYAGISIPTEKQRELGDKRYFEKIGDDAMYIYDFYKQWEHRVELEAVDIEMMADRVYPQCVDGEGACPPEFCEGIVGYNYMMEVLKNPQDEEHDFYEKKLGPRSLRRFMSNEFAPDQVEFREKVTKKDYELIDPYALSSSEDSSPCNSPGPSTETAPASSSRPPTSESTPKISGPFSNKALPDASPINGSPSNGNSSFNEPTPSVTSAELSTLMESSPSDEQSTLTPQQPEPTTFPM